MVVGKVEDKKCKDDVIKVIRTAIMSKQYGLEDFLASVVVESCSKYFLLFCNMIVLILVYSLEAFFLAFVFQHKVNANTVQSPLNVNLLNSQLYRGFQCFLVNARDVLGHDTGTWCAVLPCHNF